MISTIEHWTRISRICLRAVSPVLLLAAAVLPVTAVPESAPAYKVLYAFAGGADGAQPMAGLIRDDAGNLYGTTQSGGIVSVPCAPGGCGVVFKLDPSGKETVLYRFTGGADGTAALAALVRDSAGNLYGTASGGGSCSWPYSSGCGVVFKLDPTTGRETVLHSFSGGPDGALPQASLLLDDYGILYGSTDSGGDKSGGCQGIGCGVIFKLDPSTSTYTVLYTFMGKADGGVPSAGLIHDSTGNLYGTAAQGGLSRSGPCGAGCGVVFKLDPTAGTYTVLHSFTGGADGGTPLATLIRDADGNLYGSTQNGGTYGWGVIFKLDPTGKETVLHTFTAGRDGARPRAGLIQDEAGNRYGTAYQGGTRNLFTTGVVFELSSVGTFSVLDTLAADGTEGANLEAGLLLDPAGNLYGTASAGGAGFGVVFELPAADPRPIVTLVPSSLKFPLQAIGTTSAAKTVTLSNKGTASLTITDIAIGGAAPAFFTQTHTCKSLLAAGASCTISVRFKPSRLGARTASLRVTDNAAGSPQSVSLSGTTPCPRACDQLHTLCCPGFTCQFAGDRDFCLPDSPPFVNMQWSCEPTQKSGNPTPLLKDVLR